MMKFLFFHLFLSFLLSPFFLLFFIEPRERERVSGNQIDEWWRMFFPFYFLSFFSLFPSFSYIF